MAELKKNRKMAELLVALLLKPNISLFSTVVSVFDFFFFFDNERILLFLQNNTYMQTK